MNKPNRFVFFLLLAISLFLYFYRFPKMLAFDADQEFYAREYLSLFQEHKLTLLGIETSVGGMFVGPLFTYFSSFVYWLFNGNPIGMFFTTLFLASFQASLTYYLFTKLKRERVGLVAGVLVLLSSSLWNKAFAPSLINLLYPMGLFFFYILLKLKENLSSPAGKKYFLYLGILLALSVHIHFSLLFFFPIAMIFLIWQDLIKKKYIKEFIKIIIIIFFSLLPLIIFDLRHQFFLINNLGKFIGSRLFLPSENTSLSYLSSARFLITGLFGLFTHILVPKPELLANIFVASTIIFFVKKWQKEFSFRLIGLFFTVSILLFFLYRSSIPDYYWYFLLPAFFFVVSDFFGFMVQNKLGKFAVYAILAVLAISNLQFMNSTLNHYNFYLKRQVASYIKDQSQGRRVKISYDTDLGLGFGFDYLLRYEGVNIDNDSFEENYHIVIKSYENYEGREFKEPGSPVSIKVVKLANNI